MTHAQLLSALYSAAKPMAELRAGDAVLAMRSSRQQQQHVSKLGTTIGNIITRQVFVDRVSFNLHLHDDDADGDKHGVTIHLQGGASLSVTDEHIVLLSPPPTTSAPSCPSVLPEPSMTRDVGVAQRRRAAVALLPVPARRLKVGDCMEVVTFGAQHVSNPAIINTDAGSTGSVVSTVEIVRIERWTGGIINPLTHTGFILAASPQKPNSITDKHMPSIAAAAVGVASTTVLESPWNVQQTLLSLPITFLKVSSWAFPSQFQDSEFIESAILTGTKVRTVDHGKWQTQMITSQRARAVQFRIQSTSYMKLALASNVLLWKCLSPPPLLFLLLALFLLLLLLLLPLPLLLLLLLFLHHVGDCNSG